MSQMHWGREVHVPQAPQRIVSLVPSQTELLFDLGVGDRVVGRTKFCVHPAAAEGVAKVGGTKRIDPARILALKPDLVLANKEENERELVENLEQQLPVWVSDVPDVAASRALIASYGELLGASSQAARLVAQVDQSISELPKLGGARVLYLIWQEPFMAAGQGTYIDSMLTQMGAVNVVAPQTRYPELSETALSELRPDWILLSSEPFPFKAEHVKGYSERFSPVRVLRVDGELFSWFGSRILHAEGSMESLRALANV